MNRYFVGIYCDGAARRKVFTFDGTPTEQTHGDQFAAVIGPFRTKRGAQFMADYGRGNPHCVCVSDAEQLAKIHA